MQPKLLQSMGPKRNLSLIGAAGQHLYYRMTNRPEISETFTLLETGPVIGLKRIYGKHIAIPFLFRNSSPQTYLHPAPIEPSELRLRWRSERPSEIESWTRGLLPSRSDRIQLSWSRSRPISRCRQKTEPWS